MIKVFWGAIKVANLGRVLEATGSRFNILSEQIDGIKNTDYGRTTAQDERHREETVATSDVKKSEVAAVGSLASIMPP